MPTQENAIVLFDGVCNLCNGAVNFIIARDPEAYFKFASLQSEEGQKLLTQHALPQQEFKSLVLIQEGKVVRKSSAALCIARRLVFPWSLFYGFIWLPYFLRDAVYDLIAANRYAWFGKQDQCRLPSPELEARFLEGL